MVKRRKPSDEVAAPLRPHAIEPSAATEPIEPLLPPAAYAPTLNAGFQAAAAHVQAMHEAVAGKTFDGLLRVPGLSVPTRVARGVHDAITQGVYASVRHGAGAALVIAAEVERLTSNPTRTPGARERTLRSAFNAVAGDSLAAASSPLAVTMGLHSGDAALGMDDASLAALRPRVCVFIHGLACDEQSWALRSDAWADSRWAQALPGGQSIQYGTLLAHELGVSAIYLRYNTGLPIDTNAQQLAALLERVAGKAGQVREWLMIGHSMGGLVARRAHEMASANGLSWAKRAPMIVCLGTPHQGAPLEKLGHWAASALNLSQVTQPLGRLANVRSQGIKDLRHGLKGRRKPPAPPALRLIFATLGDESGKGVGPLVGKLIGDGLVRADSAADRSADADAGADVQRVELAGLGHMSLLNHPRVYAVLREWVGTGEMR